MTTNGEREGAGETWRERGREGFKGEPGNTRGRRKSSEPGQTRAVWVGATMDPHQGFCHGVFPKWHPIPFLVQYFLTRNQGIM
jgi:hypothetical protein